MCSIVYTTIYCRRCGKYLGNNEETRMCAGARLRGQGYHRRLESKNETYHSNWTNCPACEHEYEVPNSSTPQQGPCKIARNFVPGDYEVLALQSLFDRTTKASP
ncbi:hypothetical protein FOCG_07506 [Fusarium oxysporum f. sp. radicis-lycopersici 26381]|nr:hypothetical protein FOCG_07506 [Fusarium oxysporum f. sp. radicis-lycopersici 26381]